MDGKSLVVVDGHEQKQYGRLLKGSIRFSPDSQRLAYGAATKSWDFAVVDGQEQKQYDLIPGGFVFSPDSRRFAYVARNIQMNRRHFVVVDGEEGSQYESIGNNALFFDTPNHLHYMAKKDYAFYLVEEEFK